MIKIEHVKKTYKERCVLEIEKLCIEQGEVLGIMGANGSGKTTLLRILAGTLKPDEGTFQLPQPLLYLPQQNYAFRGNLIKNVLLGSKADTAQAEAVLDTLGLLPLKEKKAASLSGGELQRLALCRLLIRPAKVLILDEPTSACDSEGSEYIMHALKAYAKQNEATIIFSTHSKSFAEAVADRVITLNNGKVSEPLKE